MPFLRPLNNTKLQTPYSIIVHQMFYLKNHWDKFAHLLQLMQTNQKYFFIGSFVVGERSFGPVCTDIHILCTEHAK